MTQKEHSMGNGAVASVIGEQGERRTLPYQEPLKTWAGHGTGAVCNLCGKPIKAQDIEYEVELDPAPGGARGLHFHFNCYRLWETQG
jgi:hypothetical protein